MTNRITTLALGAALILLLSGCASLLRPDDPANAGQSVSLVNSLTWTNPLSGKRDGARSSWPLAGKDSYDEQFPLAQLKQCGADGACAWGVMRAARSIAKVRYVPGGVQFDLALAVNVARRQEVHQPSFNAAMAIPSDVAALQASKLERRTVSLRYGKVEHVELDYGVQFDVCLLRYDAAGKALDSCDIPYI